MLYLTLICTAKFRREYVFRIYTCVYLHNRCVYIVGSVPVVGGGGDDVPSVRRLARNIKFTANNPRKPPSRNALE